MATQSELAGLMPAEAPAGSDTGGPFGCCRRRAAGAGAALAACAMAACGLAMRPDAGELRGWWRGAVELQVSPAAAALAALSERQQLFHEFYTADPSAHLFGGQLFLYTSHDIDPYMLDYMCMEGCAYQMRDYHVFTLNGQGTLEDNGVALALEDIPWADRQLWAPDAAVKDGRYYLYFPAKAADGNFYIGVAVGASPAGPFKAQESHIDGTYSIDPCVFADDDGRYYLYFGGLQGGQLEKYPGAPTPRAALLADDMVSLAAGAQEVSINFPNASEARDSSFYEATWVHKCRGCDPANGQYYMSWSTGHSRRIAYATATSPLGPFSYRGILLTEVAGWTMHHSIIEVAGQWWLFYHDAARSGENTKRDVKAARLQLDANGSLSLASTHSAQMV